MLQGFEYISVNFIEGNGSDKGICQIEYHDGDSENFIYQIMEKEEAEIEAMDRIQNKYGGTPEYYICWNP